MSRFCFMTLKTSHILRSYKLHPIFMRYVPFCLNGGKERNVNQVIRAWNGLFRFRALKTRYISRILYIIFLLKAYFAIRLEEWDLKSPALGKKMYLSSHLSFIWAVPLHGFKIDAYLAIYHARRICLRKAS